MKKKAQMEIFVFCVIAFERIKIQTCSAPQNDRLNFSFVKVVGKKKATLQTHPCNKNRVFPV
jgi:hypothetical protein